MKAYRKETIDNVVSEDNFESIDHNVIIAN